MTRAAVLIHGGFLRPEVRRTLGRAVTRDDVLSYVNARIARTSLIDTTLFRTFYYDAKPLRGTAIHPADGSAFHLSGSMAATETHDLIAALESTPGVTVRLGTLRHDGWRLGKAAQRARKALPANVMARDLVPSIRQTGVEAAMAVDLSVLALKRNVDAILLVSNDPASGPALQLARNEGLQVFLDPLGRPPTRALLSCVDGVLEPIKGPRGRREGKMAASPKTR